jgi:hypothetical protein
LHDQRIQLRRAAAAIDAHSGDPESDVRPILAGRLRDFRTADQLDLRLAILGAGVEPRVVERQPARIAHHVGHPQRCFRRGRRGDVDPYLQLARRLGRAIGFELGDLAIDLALFSRGIPDRGIRGRDLLGHRGEGRSPFGNRPRLTLVADAGGRGFGKALGKLAPRIGRVDRALQIRSLVLQSFDALVEFRQIERGCRARRPRVDGPDGQLCARLALDPQGGCIEAKRKVLCDQRRVARGQIQRDDAADARAIGIDGDGIDGRCRVQIGRP